MSSVQVILLRDQPNLGSLGDVVKVKRGHARNHLVPRGLARTYSKEAMAEFERMKEQIIKEQQETRLAYVDLHGKLDGYTAQTVVQAQEDGSLYGSVSTSTVVDLLKEQGFAIKREQVQLPGDEPIKSVGDYDLAIRVDSDLVATVKFSVLSSKE